jgi:hypothetical protein
MNDQSGGSGRINSRRQRSQQKSGSKGEKNATTCRVSVKQNYSSDTAPLEELSGNACKKDKKRMDTCSRSSLAEATPKKTPIRIYSVTKGISISFSLTCPDPSITLPYPYEKCNAKCVYLPGLKTCSSFPPDLARKQKGTYTHLDVQSTSTSPVLSKH